MEDIIRQLIQYKETRGLKNHQLAKLLDTTEGTISRWLNGKSYPSYAWRELIRIRLFE